MNADSGTFARATTGTAIYAMNQNFTPKVIFFFASGKSADTETHMAIGYWHNDGSGALDGTLQASSGKSSETRSKTLSHYAGTTEKLGFTVTGVDVGEFTLNWSAADSAYNVHWLAFA